MPLIVEALVGREEDPAVQRLIDAFDGHPVAAKERLVGEPAYLSRRLQFASGSEIVMHDDAVVAVVLHAAPTGFAANGFNLSQWIPGLDKNATLADLKAAIDAPRTLGGMGFMLDGAYAEPSFKNNRGWNDPGNLLSISFTVEAPQRACRPEDDDCPSCCDLLVRAKAPGNGVDVEQTIAVLAGAAAAGLIIDSPCWVPLADLHALHASRLMERVESQLSCTACKRIICLTLYRESPATFEYTVFSEARQRPLEAIPPVEQWGDDLRLAQDRDAMHYVDHQPGSWFLVEQQGTLFLEARYWRNSMVDSSALIRLDQAETDSYRVGGHDYLSELVHQIEKSGPHTDGSPYFQRDLYRGPDSATLSKCFEAAIVNHTWIAEQRRGS
ncbi:hypothetical protein [Paenarthrobacter nicotinovorans]|uniref:hypothetical protein n=1 Tax=Paenarthrobacter nicotinovorans TaxID=29320 RepID=UPI00047D211B|nr:hypothetical protein [Paenarthrobacter nicotinovorans]